MFRTTKTKLPFLVLALLACFVSVSGPVRVITLTQESESEIADTLKVKEFARHDLDSRKLRQRHIHRPLWRLPRLDETEEKLLVKTFHQVPKSIFLDSLPPLRAPPA
jgi:hypothetical protein